MNEVEQAEHAVENYFAEMSKTYNTQGGTDEESYYPALAVLLNEIGKELSVVCVSQARDMGDGRPDFGLYADDQADKRPPVVGQVEPPKHGVIEAKGLDIRLDGFEKSDQVKKYLRGYQLVTTTNYREFHLFRRNDDEEAEPLESLVIAKSEEDFWKMTSTVRSRRRAAREHGPRLWEFLKRSMVYSSSISEPKHVAMLLASYAREAFVRIEAADKSGRNDDLKSLKEDMEVGLGRAFESDGKIQGEHLFHSMLVQTLFYGIFSAWASHKQDESTSEFDWRLSASSISIPVIRNLFVRLALSSQVGALNLTDVLEKTGNMLNRVKRGMFFRHFDRGEAIRHFYQPFLKAFDPESQVTMGVWYTPPEIVKYMVERVDSVLRNELKIPAGLADENVVVLDPCCGTGAYVIEVLRRIEKTLREESDDDSVGKAVRKAAMTRVKGFEVMPAPFVVAHWQVNEFLSQLGAPLEDSERVSIFLTNSLVGWNKKDDQKTLSLGLKDEYDLASEVKLNDRIMVVIANPPYFGCAEPLPGEEARLVRRYKKKLRESGKARKSQLDDPYVKFFSVAEERIMKESRGIVSYITNGSYLTGKSTTGMRMSFLETFDKMWIEETGGDVFKLGDFQDGIGIGVAANLLVKTGRGGGGARFYTATLTIRDRSSGARIFSTAQRTTRRHLKAGTKSQHRTRETTFRSSQLRQIRTIMINGRSSWKSASQIDAVTNLACTRVGAGR